MAAFVSVAGISSVRNTQKLVNLCSRTQVRALASSRVVVNMAYDDEGGDRFRERRTGGGGERRFRSNDGGGERRFRSNDGEFRERRAFPDKNLQVYVGNISWATTDEGLAQAFEGAGSVASARIVRDRETGRSRGFGFVTFQEEASCDKAVQMMNGEFLDGRELRVDKAGNRPARGDDM